MPRNLRFHWILPARRVLPSFGFPPPRQRRRLWKPLPTGTPSPLDSPANRVLSPLLDDPEPRQPQLACKCAAATDRCIAHCKGDFHPLWTPWRFQCKRVPKLFLHNFPPYTENKNATESVFERDEPCSVFAFTNIRELMDLLSSCFFSQQQFTCRFHYSMPQSVP